MKSPMRGIARKPGGRPAASAGAATAASRLVVAEEWGVAVMRRFSIGRRCPREIAGAARLGRQSAL
jgi:hypothetical protein